VKTIEEEPMSEDEARDVPSSDEIGRALRRCWQPVARIEDLRDGPSEQCYSVKR
jgi:hypothetical protein